MQVNIKQKWIDFISELQKPRYEDLRKRNNSTQAFSFEEAMASAKARPAAPLPNAVQSTDDLALEKLAQIVIRESDEDVSDLLPPPPQVETPVQPPATNLQIPIASETAPAPSSGAPVVAAAPAIAPADPLDAASIAQPVTQPASATEPAAKSISSEPALDSLAGIKPIVPSPAKKEEPDSFLPSVADVLKKKEEEEKIEQEKPFEEPEKEPEQEPERPKAAPIGDVVEEPSVADPYIAVDPFADLAPLAAVAPPPPPKAPLAAVAPPPPPKDPLAAVAPPPPPKDPLAAVAPKPQVVDALSGIAPPAQVKHVIQPPPSNVPKPRMEPQVEVPDDDDYDPLEALAELTRQSKSGALSAMSSPEEVEKAVSSEAAAALRALSESGLSGPPFKSSGLPKNIPVNRKPSAVAPPSAGTATATGLSVQGLNDAFGPGLTADSSGTDSSVPPFAMSAAKKKKKKKNSGDLLAGLGDLGGLIVSASESQAAPEAEKVRRKREMEKDE